MIINPEAFVDAPEISTRRITLTGVKFDPEVSLDYTADERNLLIHDWFDGTLYLIDLTRPNLPVTVAAKFALGFTPDRTPGGSANYLLTLDWHLFRRETWDAVGGEKLVCKILQESVEPPLLLRSFGDLLAVYSTSSITIVDTRQGAVVTRVVLEHGSDAVNPWVNVRAIKGRLCVEHLDWSRGERLRAQTYRLHDCISQTDVYIEHFRGDDMWFWPLYPYHGGSAISRPGRGDVLLFRDSLARPIEVSHVGKFNDKLDTFKCEGSNTFSVFGNGELWIQAKGMLCRPFPVTGSYGRFALFNNGVHAIALYEWGSRPPSGGIQLTGVFDYQRREIVGRTHGHINGAVKKASLSSRYLTTVYGQYSSAAIADPKYPTGTVLVSDFDPAV